MCRAAYMSHSHGLPCEVVIISGAIFKEVEADREATT